MSRFISYKNAIDYLKEVGVWDEIKYRNWSVMDTINTANQIHNEEQRNKQVSSSLKKRDSSLPPVNQHENGIHKIIVPSENIKQQLLLALEYLSNIKEIDKSYIAISDLLSLKDRANVIEVDNEQ